MEEKTFAISIYQFSNLIVLAQLKIHIKDGSKLEEAKKLVRKAVENPRVLLKDVTEPTKLEKLYSKYLAEEGIENTVEMI